MLSLEELLLLSEAGTVDLSLIVHASLYTCLIAFLTDDLLGLLGILNLGLGSSAVLMLGILSFLVRLTGLGSNLSTGLEVLNDLLEFEPEELDFLLCSPLLDLLDPDPEETDSAMCSSILSRCSRSVLFLGSGFVPFSEPAPVLALLLDSDNKLSLRLIHRSSS